MSPSSPETGRNVGRSTAEVIYNEVYAGAGMEPPGERHFDRGVIGSSFGYLALTAPTQSTRTLVCRYEPVIGSEVVMNPSLSVGLPAPVAHSPASDEQSAERLPASSAHVREPLLRQGELDELAAAYRDRPPVRGRARYDPDGVRLIAHLELQTHGARVVGAVHPRLGCVALVDLFGAAELAGVYRREIERGEIPATRLGTGARPNVTRYVQVQRVQHWRSEQVRLDAGR